MKKEVNTESVIDDLLEVLKKAVKQSKHTFLKGKRKTVETSYDGDMKKPSLEVTEESESMIELRNIVDVNVLKTVSGILKEISELTSKDSELSEDSRGIIFLADVKDLKDSDEECSMETATKAG